MSRPTLVVLLLALAASSLSACNESVTAPVRNSIMPSADPSYSAGGAATCKGGWVSSTGRC